VVPTVAGCIDLVVHISAEDGARRVVREVLAIPGRVEGDVVEASEVFVTRDDRLVRADGWPPHVERFTRAGFDLTELLAGVQKALR
jgi:pilus assembly protein CpaF